jgi:CBS domain-containing protein
MPRRGPAPRSTTPVKKLTAKDIMNPEVITVRDDLTVQELADLFTERMISGAPVVDDDGRLVGVVSLSDVVRAGGRKSGLRSNASPADYYTSGWENSVGDDELEELHVENDGDQLVRDIMTPTIFEVPESMPIGEMADTMIRGRIHRLIVTRGDHVVGIVSTLDMLKAIRSHA